MIVAIDAGNHRNPANLSERITTYAIEVNTTPRQVAIHWPAGSDAWLSMQPDGQWGSKSSIDGAFEIANVLPEGFEYNPTWSGDGASAIGNKSIVVSGRILKE